MTTGPDFAYLEAWFSMCAITLRAGRPELSIPHCLELANVCESYLASVSAQILPAKVVGLPNDGADYGTC